MTYGMSVCYVNVHISHVLVKLFKLSDKIITIRVVIIVMVLVTNIYTMCLTVSLVNTVNTSNHRLDK